MTEPAKFQIEINLNDPELGDAENQQQVQNLQKELQDTMGVETVPSQPPEGEFYPSIGKKSISGFLTGILMAEVNPANIAKLFGFLSERLGNKPIRLRVKAPDGRELEVEASSKEEVEYAIAQAERFMNQE